MDSIEYQEIRERMEADGYKLEDEEYQELVRYARRKAEVAGKDESYLELLLPDVIREHFIRQAINTAGRAIMEIKKYVQEVKDGSNDKCGIPCRNRKGADGTAHGTQRSITAGV